jgi:D-mannonate dehydratase
MLEEEKVENQKLHQVPVPTHPISMNLKIRTRRYGKNIDNVQSEISFGQIAAPE